MTNKNEEIAKMSRRVLKIAIDEIIKLNDGKDPVTILSGISLIIQYLLTFQCKIVESIGMDPKNIPKTLQESIDLVISTALTRYEQERKAK